ncbi:hypothetical protein I8751_02510 [Nostocaceae cyanobacterium CENA357]|uniref:Uncharacterized protein n=1 Tax=Atlanticothrix silvestris CENA357 TaxID=1725252 RepID=A0A8J7L3T7_9CYAN|nr:hypothetical protein [Atlanticothrix silvestris]MBH8551272.1 hypothetical protein [Atlanticothrix silvestris CENA357]
MSLPWAFVKIKPSFENLGCDNMKITDLPASVLEELCQSEYWRIDIDPGFNANVGFL